MTTTPPLSEKWQARAALNRLEVARRASAPEWQTLAKLRTPHAKQIEFINCPAKYIMVRGGRRGGKTTGIALDAIQDFLKGIRVLYASPTQEQVGAFWWEVKSALQPAIDAGYLYKNDTEHYIEVKGTKNRIRAKTAWNADTLRGDYADKLILDEFQLMSEDTLERVGYPMLMDNNGDLVLIYTPPSLASKTRTKASDPQHAAKMFKIAQADTTGLWAAFHFTSHDNPHISAEAIGILASTMTTLAYEQEILALDKDEAPGALLTRAILDSTRVKHVDVDMARVVVGVDPTGSTTNECGIVVAGLGTDGHAYVLEDCSLLATPDKWARTAIQAYHRWQADRMVIETNFGGDMVKNTIRSTEDGKHITFREAHASRGKAVRAEPVAAQYERGKIHNVGSFQALEDEWCLWIPGSTGDSPNRLDAAVWALSDLIVKKPADNNEVRAIYD